MRKIKFSHEYQKFPHTPSPSRLIQVIEIDSTQLSDQFRAYDTRTLDNEMYKLPKGKLIILLLLTADYIPHLWTTIRRYTPTKCDYYQSCVGDLFEIVVTDS